jgi:hypothetical protein
MATLTKTNAAKWQGNKLGTNGATWSVKGQEHIVCFATRSGWFAVNTQTNVRTSAYSRAELCAKLAA